MGRHNRPLPRAHLTAPSCNYLVMPDQMIRLTVHGFNRLIAEDLIEPCNGCKAHFGAQPQHTPADQFYHLIAVEDYGIDELLENAVGILAEPLH